MLKDIKELGIEALGPILYSKKGYKADQTYDFLLDESSERLDQLPTLLNSLYLALYTVQKQKRFLICSTFYSPIEVIIGIISSNDDIPLSRIQSRLLSQYECDLLEGTLERLSTFNLWISDKKIVDNSILKELKINMMLNLNRSSLNIEMQDY